MWLLQGHNFGNNWFTLNYSIWSHCPPHARLQFKFQNQENNLDWTSGLLECASMSKSVRRASVNLTPRKPHLVDHFSGRCRTCRMDAGEEGGGRDISPMNIRAVLAVVSWASFSFIFDPFQSKTQFLSKWRWIRIRQNSIRIRILDLLITVLLLPIISICVF